MNSLQSSDGPQQSPKLGTTPEPALKRRRYGAGLRELGDAEWYARLGPANQQWYVPLGTTDPAAAARQARTFAADIQQRGWERTGSSIPREFTLAISWLESPMAWTYVCLFTLPRTLYVEAPEPSPNRLRVTIIEPDPVFRSAICHGLSRIPGVTCEGWASEQPGLSQVRRRQDNDIVLVNRYLPSFVTGKLQTGKGGTSNGLLVFGYGIYPTSDDVFASVSGVDAGYFLRRRSLATVLEPLSGAFTSGQLNSAETPRAIRRYFQNIFTSEAEASNTGGLTVRERQILACIQRGLRDKEIATSLGISPLTVHTHLKHVFHKLGAHTRTEAVVKYLEK